MATIIEDYWENKLRAESAEKITLQMIIFPPNWKQGPHPMWFAGDNTPYHIQAATIRAKLIVGRYHTQANVRVFRPQTDPTCLLCGAAIEDDVHFLAVCQKLQPHREKRLEKIKECFSKESLPQPSTPIEIASVLLNGSAYTCDVRGSRHGDHVIHLSSLDNAHYANKLANATCYALHIARDIAMNCVLMDSTAD